MGAHLDDHARLLVRAQVLLERWPGRLHPLRVHHRPGLVQDRDFGEPVAQIASDVHPIMLLHGRPPALPSAFGAGLTAPLREGGLLIPSVSARFTISTRPTATSGRRSWRGSGAGARGRDEVVRGRTGRPCPPRARRSTTTCCLRPDGEGWPAEPRRGSGSDAHTQAGGVAAAIVLAPPPRAHPTARAHRPASPLSLIAHRPRAPAQAPTRHARRARTPTYARCPDVLPGTSGERRPAPPIQSAPRGWPGSSYGVAPGELVANHQGAAPVRTFGSSEHSDAR